jgi:AAT family amino acid transporter
VVDGLYVIVVLTAVNLTSVNSFGEFEFWFALLKVAAIVGFLLVGAALLCGWLPGVQSLGMDNFTGAGFAPSGFAGIATALFMVAFAFGGTEIVSVAAAETVEPASSVKKKQPGPCCGASWSSTSRHLRDCGSRARGFRRFEEPVRRRAGRSQHARRSHCHYLVAVAALLSALNVNLYRASRMACSLARRGEAPRVLAIVSRPGCRLSRFG